MTDLRPLFESSEDPLERALLSAALDELPSAASLRNAALGLGLTATAATALAATLPATSAVSTTLVGAASSVAPGSASAALAAGAPSVAGAVSTGTATAALTTTTLVVLSKGIVGGALVSIMAIGTLQHAMAPTPPKPQARVEARSWQTPAAVAPRAPLEPRAEEREPGLVSEPEPELEPAPVVVLSPRRDLPPRGPHAPPLALGTAPRTEGAASAPISSSAFAPPLLPPQQPAVVTTASGASLAAETRLIDRARAALSADDLEGAARLLDAYAASHRGGVLAPEATVLRVRLLLARGQKSAAVSQARSAIAQQPEGADADLYELGSDR